MEGGSIAWRLRVAPLDMRASARSCMHLGVSVANRCVQWGAPLGITGLQGHLAGQQLLDNLGSRGA